MRKAKIISTGLYAPDRVVDNQYFNEYYKQDVDTFLRQRRNIFERRYASDEQTTSDLVVEAAKEAIQKAGLTPNDIDLIILATDTPDFISPSTAVVVQHKLGAKNAGTFDLNTACAGFVTALDVGRKYLEADTNYNNVLVAGGYLMSRFIDYNHRNTASLFADGAGAVVLTATDAQDDTGILTAVLESKGQYHDYMGIYNGGACNPIMPDAAGRVQLLEFRQKFPKTFNLENWTGLANTLSERTGIPLASVDHFFFTQLNIESIWETMDALNLSREKAFTVMRYFGYTGSACIPMALADADEKRVLREGDIVFLIASGGGASLAGSVIRWSYDPK